MLIIPYLEKLRQSIQGYHHQLLQSPDLAVFLENWRQSNLFASITYLDQQCQRLFSNYSYHDVNVNVTENDLFAKIPTYQVKLVDQRLTCFHFQRHFEKIKLPWRHFFQSHTHAKCLLLHVFSGQFLQQSLGLNSYLSPRNDYLAAQDKQIDSQMILQLKAFYDLAIEIAPTFDAKIEKIEVGQEVFYILTADWLEDVLQKYPPLSYLSRPLTDFFDHDAHPDQKMATEVANRQFHRLVNALEMEWFAKQKEASSAMPAFTLVQEIDAKNAISDSKMLQAQSSFNKMQSINLGFNVVTQQMGAFVLVPELLDLRVLTDLDQMIQDIRLKHIWPKNAKNALNDPFLEDFYLNQILLFQYLQQGDSLYATDFFEINEDQYERLDHLVQSISKMIDVILADIEKGNRHKPLYIVVACETSEQHLIFKRDNSFKKILHYFKKNRGFKFLEAN
jgi:hypothetical protein